MLVRRFSLFGLLVLANAILTQGAISQNNLNAPITETSNPYMLRDTKWGMTVSEIKDHELKRESRLVSTLNLEDGTVVLKYQTQGKSVTTVEYFIKQNHLFQGFAYAGEIDLKESSIIQSGLKDRLGKPVKEHFSDDHIKRLVAEMYSLPLDQVHCLITAWSNSQTIVYHVVGGILGKSEKLNFVMFISSDYLKRNLGVDFTRPDLMIGGYFRGAKWGMLVTDVVQMESEHGSTRLEDQETSQGLWLKFSDIIFTGLGADQIHYCFHDGKLTSSMLLLGLHSGLGGFKEDFDTFENALDLAFGSPSKSDIDEASQKEESFVLFTERSTQTTTIRHFLAGSPKDILAIHYIVFMSPE